MAIDQEWSRRGFLSLRGLAASAGGAIAAFVPDVPDLLVGGQAMAQHLCFARRAMACEFSLHLPPTFPRLMAAAESALSEVEQLEELLTVYSDTSAMSYVNQNAADRPVRVDGRLFRLLLRSAELTRQTEGAFDIAAGALVKIWGFYRGPRRVPNEPERMAALACSGMKYVELDAENQTVRYLARGLEINLGSIGKGYAIDRAINNLKEYFGVSSTLIQGGLSSIYGLGSPLGGDERGWLVGIQNPYNPRQLLATVRLKNRALGTSGTANQYFEFGGQRYGHLLDPRSGRPVDELASASALAPDAATADALATAFFVWGLDRTRVFCQNNPEIAALLVLKPGDPGRRPSTPQVVTFNLSGREVTVGPGDSTR